MQQPSYLQSVVSPICRYSELEERVCVEQMHGTGFFITENGIFLTARHVIEGAIADAAKHKGKIGIFPMQPIDGVATSLTAPMLDYEYAEEPFDIAICRTNYRSATFFRLQQRDVEVWQDMATMGYPISATFKALEKFEIQQRAHKGYIQRIVPAGRLRNGMHPDVFELSFPVSHGLSGSPLFIHAGQYDILIGLCIGSTNSRIVDYETVLIQEGEVELREQIVRVEEIGIAHDIRKLLPWKPKCLSGLSLLEASNTIWDKSASL